MSHSTMRSTPHSSPSLQSLSRDQSPSLQPQISQTLSSKSLDTLKLKLSRDKNFSRKITLQTFFSYIILAMEIERSCSASISQISIANVNELLEYMIETHSSSNAVRIYLHTLMDRDVVTKIIESIIEFNKGSKSSLETLYTIEEKELEMALIYSSANDNNSKPPLTDATIVNVTVISSDETAKTDLPQTPPKCGFFNRLRCFFSGCCG